MAADNELDIGVLTPGPHGIMCRVGVNGGQKRSEKTIACRAVPGNAIRVSVRFRGDDSLSARILAFVDPLTGKGVIRMGMFDVSEDNRGHEVGSQIVYDTDDVIFEVEK